MNNEISILCVRYEGFKVVDSTPKYAMCFLYIQEELYSPAKIYELSIQSGYTICSEVKINYAIKEESTKNENSVAEAYYGAERQGYTLTTFPDRSIKGDPSLNTPRFSEDDFTKIITSAGGRKIPESNDYKTPDFQIDDIVIELKDLQNESLLNKNRQNSVAQIFADMKSVSVNLDPQIDYGPLTEKYHRSIENTLKNHVKAASRQIKVYKKSNKVRHAGMILLNTGMYSLPLDLFKSMVERILEKDTSTIEFVFIFSQVMQSNGLDWQSVFYQDFIGSVPDKVNFLKQKTDQLIERKMTDIMLSNIADQRIEPVCPISFIKGDKIFFWNPGKLPLSWDKEEL